MNELDNQDGLNLLDAVLEDPTVVDRALGRLDMSLLPLEILVAALSRADVRRALMECGSSWTILTKEVPRYRAACKKLKLRFEVDEESEEEQLDLTLDNAHYTRADTVDVEIGGKL